MNSIHAPERLVTPYKTTQDNKREGRNLYYSEADCRSVGYEISHLYTARMRAWNLLRLSESKGLQISINLVVFFTNNDGDKLKILAFEK